MKTLSPGSWQDYYTWRGLSLDSPMAVLLTYPLTVYYVITHLVPQSCKERRQDGRLGVGLAAARVSPPHPRVSPPPYL